MEDGRGGFLGKGWTAGCIGLPFPQCLFPQPLCFEYGVGESAIPDSTPARSSPQPAELRRVIGRWLGLVGHHGGSFFFFFF